MYKREPLPYYAGLVSFFRTPAVEIEDITEGMAVVAGVPIDMGVIYARVGLSLGKALCEPREGRVRHVVVASHHHGKGTPFHDLCHSTYHGVARFLDVWKVEVEVAEVGHVGLVFEP